MKGTIFFDLDGTIADTSRDIYNSLNRTLQRFQIPAVGYDVVVDFIGDGVAPLVKKLLLHLKRIEEEEMVIQEFLRDYRRNIAEKTYLYPHITDVIFTLRDKKFTVILLTNKFEDLTIRLLSELCIQNLFDGIVCGNTFDVKKPSPELLGRIKTRYTISHPVIVVGDGLNDLMFALNLNFGFILTRWGFSTYKVEEYIKEKKLRLNVAYADFPKDLPQIIERYFCREP